MKSIKNVVKMIRLCFIVNDVWMDVSGTEMTEDKSDYIITYTNFPLV